MGSGAGMSVFRREMKCIAIGTSLIAMSTAALRAQSGPSTLAPPQTQGASLTGVVRDPVGAPIPFAYVSVAEIRSVADSTGRFLLANLAPGTTNVLFRRLGFTPKRVAVTLVDGRLDSMNVVLTVLPFELAGITTEASTIGRMAEFERHRATGHGVYLDRLELEKRRTPRLTDVLRRIPGVRVVTDRAGRQLVRMGRSSMGRDCPPEFWIDGVRAQFLGADDVPVSDIEALEIYRGPSGLPPEFNSRFTNAQCGAIIIWTRVPG
jgi:hypothetical protein